MKWKCQEQLCPSAPGPGSTKVLHNQFSLFKLVDQSCRGSSLKLVGLVLFFILLHRFTCRWANVGNKAWQLPFLLAIKKCGHFRALIYISGEPTWQQTGGMCTQYIAVVCGKSLGEPRVWERCQHDVVLGQNLHLCPQSQAQLHGSGLSWAHAVWVKTCIALQFLPAESLEAELGAEQAWTGTSTLHSVLPCSEGQG